MVRPKPLPGAKHDDQDAHKTRRRGARSGRTSEPGGDGTAGPGRDDPREARLNELLQQFGGGGFRLLAERTTSDGTTEYLGPVAFNSDLYEAVRLRWGGGLFGGRIVDERGKYQARFLQWRIAGPPRQPGHDDNAASSPAQATGLEAAFVALNATMAKVLERLERPQPAAPPDPVDQVVKIARALRESSGAQVAPPVDSMGMVRELYGFLREIRDETAPAPAADTGFGLVMKEGVSPLVQVLTRKLDLDEARERRRGGMPPRQQAAAAVIHPHPANDEEIVNVPEIPADELEALLMTIPTAGRRFILSAAENDEDPEDYVPLLLNKLSDDAFATMARNLAREDFLTVLIKVVPAYGQHPAWFGRLVDALRVAVADDLIADDPAYGVAPVTETAG